MSDNKTNTGGGTYVGKDVDTNGGSFIGRDSSKDSEQHAHNSNTTVFSASHSLAILIALIIFVLALVVISANNIFFANINTLSPFQNSTDIISSGTTPTPTSLGTEAHNSVEIEVTQPITVEVTRIVEVVITQEVTPYPTYTLYPTYTPFLTFNRSDPDAATVTPLALSQPSTVTILSFTDKFDSNDRGWALGSDSNGAIRISQSRLVASPNSYKAIWIPVPNLEIDDEFYMQAQISLLEGHFCDSNAGLVVGEAGGNYNGFVIGANCGSGNYVAFLDSGSVKFETPVAGDTLLHVSSPTRTLGLEASNGLYTFYIDGKATESFPIEQSYGNQVGLLAWDSGV